jgi:hypothetical protein
MKEAASTSETSVNFYQTIQHINPEDSHLHTRRRENLKSPVLSFCLSRNTSVKHFNCSSMHDSFTDINTAPLNNTEVYVTIILQLNFINFYHSQTGLG